MAWSFNSNLPKSEITKSKKLKIIVDAEGKKKALQSFMKDPKQSGDDSVFATTGYGFASMLEIAKTDQKLLQSFHYALNVRIQNQYVNIPTIEVYTQVDGKWTTTQTLDTTVKAIEILSRASMELGLDDPFQVTLPKRRSTRKSK